MDWMDWLRLLTLAAMIVGAVRGWKKRPRKLVVNGKPYYRLDDGRVSTRWGRIVTDRELNAQIENEENLQGREQVTPRRR